MKSYWIRVDSKSNDWCLQKREGDLKTHKEGHRPCNDRGRDWCAATVSKGTPKIAAAQNLGRIP